MFQRIRRSLALKLILAAAVPSTAVLLLGLWILIRHTQTMARTDPERAFEVLREGAVLGTLLTLTFAATAVGLVTRRLMIKPAQELMKVMGRAETGDILVRAKVHSDDELGRLSRSFNTMLAKVTDMAVTEIEQRREVSQLQRELELQEELKAANAQLGERAREMELVLDVSRALSGTLDLREQLGELGRRVCARLDIEEFTALLVDEQSHQLTVEALAGTVPPGLHGLRLAVGEGVTGEAAARGETIYVTDVEADPRFIHYPAHKKSEGSFLAVPLRANGRVVGVMNLSRRRVAAFSAQEVRLAEAVAVQAGLAIANARLYAQTLELSYTDPLSGVPNRRALAQRLEQEWTRSLRFGDELSVLMIDLDLFKNVNDAFGHAVGDGILRSVATLLKRNLRKVDTLARYGGDEFCVLLPRVARAEALDAAEKLRRAVSQAALPGAPGEPPLHLTISIGVASHSNELSETALLLEAADRALYLAKRGGRDQVRTI